MSSKVGRRGGQRKHRRPRSDAHWTTKAGPVTVTRADGTSSTLSAYSPAECRAIVQVRGDISPDKRLYVLRRDNWTCRYCRSTAGPFHIDHVVPRALGGSSAVRNLVTSCESCNLTKGAQVWKPLPLQRGRAPTSDAVACQQ